MDVRELVGSYIRDSGWTVSWVARKAAELGCKTLTAKKLNATLLCKRGMSADELLYVCKAMKANPDLFMPVSA